MFSYLSPQFTLYDFSYIHLPDTINLFFLLLLLQLSPALRNRFTEIWCPPSNVREDLIKIIEHNIKRGIALKSTCEGAKLHQSTLENVIDHSIQFNSLFTLYIIEHLDTFGR